MRNLSNVDFHICSSLLISGVLWKILIRFAKLCKNSAFLLFSEIFCWIALILNSGWLLYLHLQNILIFLSLSCVCLLSLQHRRPPCCLNFSHEKRGLKLYDGADTILGKDITVISDFLFASFHYSLVLHSTKTSDDKIFTG